MGLLDDWADRWASRAAGPGPEHLPEPPRALTAAGQKVNLRRPDPAHTRHEQWQYAAWQYRDDVPEMRFAGDFIASSLGRLRVFPAENRPRGEEPVPLEAATERQQRTNGTGVSQHTIDAAVAATERLNLNQHGTSLLSRFGENLEFAGECYLLGERDDDGQEQWTVRSILECQITTGGGRLVDPVTGSQQRELRDDECELMRLWSPDPAFFNKADAPVRGVLKVLREMDLIQQRGIAHAQSRISLGKGMYLPQELLTVAGPAAVAADLPGMVDDPGSSAMLTTLIEYMSLAVNNPDDPSSLAPLLMTGPATIDGTPTKELIGTFDIHGEDPSGLSERYEALMMRFARGINLAPERVRGIGEATNTWTANTITADEVKVSIEPRAERMCDSLTAAYLRRMLKAMGIAPSEIAKVCLWYDASELVQNPNRAQDAKDLFQAGELSGEALRRSAGFTANDAPTGPERLARALTTGELAGDAVPPLLSLYAGKTPTVDDFTVLERARASIPTPQSKPDPAAPNVAPAKPSPRQIDSTPPVGERSQPATASQPGALGASAGTPKQWKLDRELGRKLARVDQQFVTRVLAAADATLGRALERAANRVRGDAQKDPKRKTAFTPGADPRVILAAGGRRLAGDLTDAQLLDGAFSELEVTFRQEVDTAAEAVEAILEKRLPGPLTAAGGGRGVAAAIRGNAGRAWSWLSDRLHRHAAEVLYGGRQPIRGGESSPGLTPVSLVRGAATLLGGLGEQHPGINDDGVPAGSRGAPTPGSGPGSGDVVLSRLRVAGAVVAGHEWNYHYIGQEVFSPHRRLDEETFASWTDPKLWAGPDSDWILTGYLHPQDHPGCQCTSSVIALVPMVEDADPRSDEVAALRAEATG